MKRKERRQFKIKLFGFLGRDVDRAAREIVDTAVRTGVQVAGPVPLPTHRKVFTVNRSPHVNKEAMEQFERRKHKRVIVIYEPTAETVEALKRLNVPSGVEITISQDYHTTKADKKSAA